MLIGYSLLILDNEYDVKKPSFCRAYELHIKYHGKAVISKPRLLSVKYIGFNFEKEFSIGEEITISFVDQQELLLMYFLFSNEDFLLETSGANQYLRARQIELTFEMYTLTKRKYIEKLSIIKHLVVEPEKEFNTANVELLVASAYEVIEASI